jgi:outer membrane protein assembly factor BamB
MRKVDATWRGAGRWLGSVLGGLLVSLGGCAALESDGFRRQRLADDRPEDRSYVTVRWKQQLRDHGIFTYQPEEHAGAAVSHGGRRLYVGAGDGKLYAVEALTGKRRWGIDLGAAVTSAPRVVEHLGLLYVGAADGALHAVELDSGERRWRYRTKGIPYQPAVYADGVVFFTNHRDQLFSLDARTGRWRWSYDRETPQSFTVAGHGGATVQGRRLLAGFSDGTLVCLGARGGQTRWTRSLTGEHQEYVDVDSTPVVRDKVVYAASLAGGVFAVMLEGGALRWRYPVAGVTGVAVADDRVYFASAKEGLHAVDTEGRLRWRQHLKAGAPGTPHVRGRALYITYADGGLFIVDRYSGRLIQRFNPGGGISGPPLLTADSLYLMTNRGGFFAFTRR